MRGEQFYHRGRCALAVVLALALPPAGAQGQPPRAAWEEIAALPEVPPPRSIDDITQLLEHYRPDPIAAARARERAEAQPPQTPERGAIFEFYFRRGNAAGNIGRIDQQIADLRKAVDEYGEPGTANWVRAVRDLAAAESQGGNMLNALQRARQAQERVPQNMLAQELGALQQLVVQYVAVGDFEEARDALRKAEAAFTMLRRSNGWSNFGSDWTYMISRARGELARGEGRYVEAENFLRRALSAIEESLRITASGQRRGNSDPDMLDRQKNFRELVERGIGSTLLSQGRIVDAEAIIRQSLRHSLERVGRGATSTAQGLTLLAGTIAEQGRYAESARLALESLKSFEMAGAPPDSLFLSRARRTYASALVAQGLHAESIAEFQRMRDGLKTNPELLKKVGSGDLDWVLAMLRTGDQPGAERMAQSMHDHAANKYGEGQYRTATARAFYAMTLAARGEREGALKLFRAAVPLLLDQARNEVETESGTVKRQQRLVTILESYLGLLAGNGLGDAHAEESFRLADVARNSAVQRALTASAARANIGDPQLALLARREQDAQGRLSTLSELLLRLLGAPPEQQLPQVQARLGEDIAALKKEREQLRREIAAKYPDYAELVDPKPAIIADVSRVLRPGETMLAFYFGEEAGFVWALQSGGRASFTRVALNRRELEAAVAGLRKSLDPQASSIEDIPPFDVAAAHALYQKLLRPVEPLWQDAHTLLVAPHADLGLLPLAVLPTAPVAQPGRAATTFASYKEVPWLVRKVAIAQLPSVTSLASLRKLPPGDASRRPFIGFGDPFFSMAQAQAAGTQLADAGNVRTRGVPLRLRNTPKTGGVSSAELAMLPRLPDTGDEIREIAKVLAADLTQDIFLQARATERAVFDADLAKHRVVMFATHGLVPGDLNGLTQPALALTSPDVADGNGDGLLTLAEILGLRLNADWVVLSACNTAAGDGSGGEALSGLGRAFFYSGARALLASNWPVETVSARTLMTDLFRRQNARLGKSEALRQSMLALIDGPGARNPETGRTDYAYAHPLFWAPFVIVGD